MAAMPRRLIHTDVATAVESYLATLQMSELLAAKAEIARALARSLDAAAGFDTGAWAQAIPNMSRELRETLKEISEEAGATEGDEFLDALGLGAAA